MALEIYKEILITLPPLQARLAGDVAVLETGTFGKTGDVKIMVERCQARMWSCYEYQSRPLDKDHDFMSYASIKGEFIEYFKDKTLIINSDDPTIFGLIDSEEDNVLTFGVDSSSISIGYKKCWCGREILIDETITGSGVYNCECGLKRPEPDYFAVEIDGI